MTLTLGVDVLTLDASVDAERATASTNVVGWDPAAQEVVATAEDVASDHQWGNSAIADITEVTGDREMTVTTPYAAGQVDPANIAKARSGRVAPSTMQGHVSFIGSTLVAPGGQIELVGVGDRMGGTAFVFSLQHSIKAGEWKTRVQMGLPKDWRSDAPGMAGAAGDGLVSPIHGLQIGTVLAIVETAEGPLADDAMIKISLPLLGDPPSEIYARFGQPYATSEAGMTFLPEIGDEVVVGFLAADPSSPVILGALHSGTNVRPNPAADPNAIKTIKTQSGLNITFDDDTIVLTVETPAGHTAVFSDEDESITITDSSGNSLEMVPDGVTLTSVGTLDITASGAISISSDADISIEASGDASIAGVNVTAEAQAGATVSGSGTAELSSSGQTTVSGSIVMIN